jgi:TRAP-type C4-dicarboxylate transport system substrate-binding protein
MVKDTVLIEASLFQHFPEEIKKAIEAESKRFGRFLNKRVEIILSQI